MVSPRVVLACAAVLAGAGAAHAQSIAVDVSQTAGYSTEDISAAATEIRGFGEIGSRIRYFAETAWGVRSASGSDVFGSAYPYGGRVQVIEAFAERTFDPGRVLIAIRGGRYRTPFGISAGSDYAYIGFLRPPLIRYDGYYALSNDFLEHGAEIVAGVPAASLEASVGTPSDVGSARRRGGLDAVLRGQGALGPLIVGVSHIRTNPYQPAAFARGRASFTGVDVRWMRAGVQARGEWIVGRPFDRTTTSGGYADLIVHRPGMGPVTAVLRAERVFYDAGSSFDVRAERYTGGARIRIPGGLSASVEIVHQPHNVSQRRPTAVDVGVTYSVRAR
jgi:hypothetical protein